jgi:hypothetical protein
MFAQGDIKQLMDVSGADDVVVGKVDHLEGGTQTIRLQPETTALLHHWIPLAWVKKVDAKGVHLNLDGALARENWLLTPEPLDRLQVPQP